MDRHSFRDHIETAKATELGRLGSNKLLVAVTDAELDERSVLTAAAHSEHAARETFRAWAAEEDDEGARAAFERVADQEAEHLDRVLDAAGEEIDLVDGGPMHAYLRGRDETVERLAAGLVGRGLVVIRTHTQIISFFVNEADERKADLFRDLKSETEAEIDAGLDLLAERCPEAADWERAAAAAEYVVQVAYDDYADALAGLGVDPKPVC
jgi:hypothetical protein